MEVIYIIAGCIAFFAIKGIYDNYNNAKKLRARIIREYGSKADKTFDDGRAKSISYYCREKKRSNCPVDDITWNDLDMDSIYYLLNNCKCVIGDEYLYYLLRNPSDDLNELKERNRVIDVLAADKELRTELGFFLGSVGQIKGISVYEYICRLKNVELDSNLKHIFQAALLLAGIGLIFYNPTVGIIATVAMFFANIISYFKRKSQIECYFTIFSYILRMAGSARKISKVVSADKNGDIAIYTECIAKAASDLAKTTRGAQIFLNPGGNGDLLQSIFDYIRMALHIDLISFNLMVKKFFDRQEEFDALYESMGFLDCMLAAASYREWTGDTCEPELHDASGNVTQKIEFTGLSHPLIPEPVVNSISTDRPVLLTGSNASGKSTFLKAVAINAILAQSIFTARAEKYSAPCFHVMSSMALQDNLALSESYYIVEIKSLKRIIDAVEEKDAVPVMCFIDEVLRGTNTVERIAASTEILKKLSAYAGMCFVATHDIELTYKLEEYYANYHFEEQVNDDEVTFDYLLHEGRTTTRNAIRLLGMLGFDKEIVDAAQKNAESMDEQPLKK